MATVLLFLTNVRFNYIIVLLFQFIVTVSVDPKRCYLSNVIKRIPIPVKISITYSYIDKLGDIKSEVLLSSC